MQISVPGLVCPTFCKWCHNIGLPVLCRRVCITSPRPCNYGFPLTKQNSFRLARHVCAWTSDVKIPVSEIYQFDFDVISPVPMKIKVSKGLLPCVASCLVVLRFWSVFYLFCEFFQCFLSPLVCGLQTTPLGLRLRLKCYLGNKRKG